MSDLPPTVIVVGSVNRDQVVRVGRLPAPGETVVGGSFSDGLGGKGANAAVAAAKLGAVCHLVACVGRDSAGEESLSELDAAGVETGAISVGDARTGIALIVVDDRGENQIAVASGANAQLAPRAVADAIAACPAPTAAVLANLEVPDEAVDAAARAAASRGYTFVLNPAPARPLSAELLARCDVVTPNEHEVAALAPDGPQSLLAAGARAVVVTRGPVGADLHRPDAPRHHQPPAPAAVVDTTGAGDAFSAALAVALASGESLEEAVRWGVAAGAAATEQPGAQAGLPDRRAIVERIAQLEATQRA